MAIKASIELKDLKIQTKIGTYGPQDIVPNEHILDLTLWITPKLALIPEDSMNLVFDYDPLILDINRLTQDEHYQTQERLITKICNACSRYHEIESLEIYLRKSPVNQESGSLGVKVFIDQSSLSEIQRNHL